MKKWIALLVLFSITLNSCDRIQEQKQQENYVSPYRGTYTGTYSGDDSGTLQIEISSKGSVHVTRHSALSNSDDIFFDGLIGASFNGNKSPTSGFKLLGNLNSPNNSYSGSWQQGNWSGTWTLTKQ